MTLALLYAATPSSLGAQSPREIAQRTFPSVVLLAVADQHRQPLSIGSGFFVRPSVVATNLHVIEGGHSATAKLVGRSGAQFVSGVVATDSERDLALLAVGGLNAASLQLGDSRSVAVGDIVYAVGNPEGLEGTFSQGIVSGIRTAGTDTLIQITAPISPGSSGGPVLDANGAVVGIAFATFRDGQNLNFAIPVNDLKPLLALSAAQPKPLSSVKGGRRALGPGEHVREGVQAVHFEWGPLPFPSGHYSFTLRNNLPHEVSGVEVLLVFLDSSNRPVDSKKISCLSSIGPNLAVRISTSGGTYFLYRVDPSVQRLSSNVEIRVLDFQIGR